MYKFEFKIIICLVFGLLWASSHNAQAADHRQVAEAIKKIEAHIQQHVQKRQIPGCAIAVVFRNQIIYMHGFGVRSMGKEGKIDPDTVFQLGSISKPIAATLTALLEHQGLLNVEDPVSDYLPGFRLHQQDPRSLKIKNVLSHTSGVPRGGFNHLIERFTPYSEIRRALQKSRTHATPGRRYDYHNAMYGLLAEITQAATYRSFPDALHFTLLKPLQMKNTSATFLGLCRSPNRASPHTKNHRGVLCACEPYSRGYYNVAPAGGINSSARDMAIFLKAQMGGYPEILPPKVLARMQTPVVSTNNMMARSKNPYYGLGWRIIEYANQKLVYHGGWLKGFTNFLAFMPEHQLGIVILHNADTRFSCRAAMKFFDTALGLPNAAEPSVRLAKKKMLNGKLLAKAPVPPLSKGLTAREKSVKRLASSPEKKLVVKKGLPQEKLFAKKVGLTTPTKEKLAKKKIAKRKAKKSKAKVV